MTPLFGEETKRRLAKSPIGPHLSTLRARTALVRTALLNNPETLGMLANDVIVERLLAGLCQPSSGFLDIGAHIGSVLSAVRAATPGVTIYAVEADPDKAAALARTHPNITLYDCAVGERDGEVTFFRDVKNPGYSSIAPGRGGEEVRIPMRPLDALLPEDAGIDLVKIDVEGAELGALRGGEATILRCRPTIVFESVLPGENALGYAPEMVWDWLTERDYRVLTPDRMAHDAPGLSKEVYLDAHVYPRRTRNYVAVANGRLDEVRARARRILEVKS